jgi:ribosome-interacting GTPase 1
VKLGAETSELKAKFARLQADLLSSLRDASGQRYDPNEYSLQRTSDGDIILVPRNTTTSGVTSSGATDNMPDNKSGRKRKPKRKE